MSVSSPDDPVDAERAERELERERDFERRCRRLLLDPDLLGDRDLDRRFFLEVLDPLLNLAYLRSYCF